jgi:putative phage-type endonuclease
MQEIEISKGIKRIKFDSFDSWLNARHGIGGSDASAVLGLSPYKTNVDLYLEKIGQRIPADISGEDYVRYGHDVEPLLRSLFALDHPEYQVEYFGDNMIRNEKYPWAHASLDGELTDQDGRKGILEIKTTNILQSMQREKWRDQIPDNYYIQVLHYLLVTEYEFVELRAQLKSVWQGQIRLETKDYHIERSEAEEDIEILRQAEEEFWQNVVKRQQPNLILPEI